MASIFDVTSQLTFYGAYHSNRTNILVHVICVPILLWTFQVLASQLPVPSVIPAIHHQFNEYLTFDLNWATIHAGVYFLYYLALEPVGALLYGPQLILSLLSATTCARNTDNISLAGIVHLMTWVAQFLSHGLAEKRAPALLDNLVGAVVLAPFFVHLEVLFKLGYRPKFYRSLQNEIGKEIAKVRKAQGDEKRKKNL
ncbi:hypothetical protein AGABI1DRAFT_113620 [Agaricus bisporus var. burnettii JB137-S8]|uniref:DUF962-domain-containing protein n=2 Tax=Agaricus bisporus var. burnettii TaxID=192524 RepID=K5XAZ7_AGABU|nr:hypothetical protein AGABI2DRAFT_191730 [Agaricus bisporus var. bisporus H97]XP_007329586.1 uncharacterized protein AGABI1DRAFT_113620 [Agaricus bisporus var. burnettii JB137-S8]EKM80438.1 hypothetical protein AGABI1DRAFT_113620 [Agaricus bisporus var. burnettii JB137-S8]EKV48082.1 hypothetical protein AGABI2DRAFT_191730 [Agaricus bisporus var. bisporus H97]KAF7776314.1 hypothetical protein Agabi119p4_4707 [Agaricus bisporus var. burnettii]